MSRVAVLGGGVGGLSVAHELSERDFDVVVLEAGDRFGGKARSFPGPERPDGAVLPAEHGFRFFPGFYQHVTETMSRIPYEDGAVTDNLVETTEVLQASTDRQWSMMTAPPTTLTGYRTSVRQLFGGPEVSADEKAYFLCRLTQLLTSSQNRLLESYDDVSWWEFIEAEKMSHKYKKNIGYGLSQSLVALRPKQASTRTMGTIYLQLIQGLLDESMEADLVLNGPTSDVWIDPWVEYLDDLGVDLQSNTPVTAIESDGRRVTGVTIDDGGSERTVTADYYVASLPLGVLKSLSSPSLEAAVPSVSRLQNLDEAWMNGIQFYLNEDVELVHGHGIYYDSPWALTTISQRQFWDEYNFDSHEDSEGILSVCISNWNDPGIVYGKPAKACTRHEIKTEVVAQLEAHLNEANGLTFSDDLVHDWCLDQAISFDRDGIVDDNAEPLFINTVGSLKHRPEPATEADNFMIATDYARTNSDLASMESANEAARRAVNAIIDRSGATAEPCDIGTLTVPQSIEYLKRIDGLIHRSRLPHPGAMTPRVWSMYCTLKSLI
ncbi:MAG: hydroxysqualene dehydroxylase [Natronomonas sp.]